MFYKITGGKHKKIHRYIGGGYVHSNKEEVYSALKQYGGGTAWYGLNAAGKIFIPGSADEIAAQIDRAFVVPGDITPGPLRKEIAKCIEDEKIEFKNLIVDANGNSVFGNNWDMISSNSGVSYESSFTDKTPSRPRSDSLKTNTGIPSAVDNQTMGSMKSMGSNISYEPSTKPPSRKSSQSSKSYPIYTGEFESPNRKNSLSNVQPNTPDDKELCIKEIGNDIKTPSPQRILTIDSDPNFGTSIYSPYIYPHDSDKEDSSKNKLSINQQDEELSKFKSYIESFVNSYIKSIKLIENNLLFRLYKPSSAFDEEEVVKNKSPTIDKSKPKMRNEKDVLLPRVLQKNSCSGMNNTYKFDIEKSSCELPILFVSIKYNENLPCTNVKNQPNESKRINGALDGLLIKQDKYNIINKLFKDTTGKDKTNHGQDLLFFKIYTLCYLNKLNCVLFENVSKPVSNSNANAYIFTIDDTYNYILIYTNTYLDSNLSNKSKPKSSSSILNTQTYSQIKLIYNNKTNSNRPTCDEYNRINKQLLDEINNEKIKLNGTNYDYSPAYFNNSFNPNP